MADRRVSRIRGRGAAAPDPNMVAAGLLHDMAAIQGSERSRFGYKRAAAAIVGLRESVVDRVSAGSLRDIPFVGPSSARIVTELVVHGHSPTVEAAIATSPRRRDIEQRRRLRGNFLSQLGMHQAMSMRLASEVVSAPRYRGDFQLHTTWSDGAESIALMAEACMSRGWTCMGVTDHSYGLPVARGMTMEAAAGQRREIDGLNTRHTGRFRIFRGVEANILRDGSLDLSVEERRQFEYVVAAPHAALRRTEDQTDRMLAAVRAPGVAILGHPRGRVYNSRGGIVAEWRRVFETAAERGVAVELDGNWHRQDLDWELAAMALEAGCIFALDSDAHSIPELGFTDYAIAHGRLARIPADRVINCWPDDRLAAWMSAISATRGQEP